MDTPGWLLLTYRVPTEPSAKRVALWRKLKGLGAIYLQNGVCLLPRTEDHLRRLKIIENEIAGMEGECVLMQATGLDPAQEQKMVARFQTDRDDQYREFLGKCDAFEEELRKEIRIEKFTYAELEEEDAELRKLERWLEKIVKLDFHGAPLAATAQAALQACRASLDDYAKKVFDAHEENH